MNIEALQIRLPKFKVILRDSKIKVIYGARDLCIDDYERLCDFHDSIEYVTEFLLLNGFKDVYGYFVHKELSIFIGTYHCYAYKLNGTMIAMNSTSLLDILREKLHIYNNYKQINTSSFDL